LHNFFTGIFVVDVLNIELYISTVDPEIVVIELSVGKTMSEWIERLDIVSIIPSVSDFKFLSVGRSKVDSWILLDGDT